MLTIDWSKAPEWANYVAMDSDGEWCWFEQKPESGIAVWGYGGKWEFMGIKNPWRESLQKRPVNTMDSKGGE